MTNGRTKEKKELKEKMMKEAEKELGKEVKAKRKTVLMNADTAHRLLIQRLASSIVKEKERYHEHKFDDKGNFKESFVKERDKIFGVSESIEVSKFLRLELGQTTENVGETTADPLRDRLKEMRNRKMQEEDKPKKATKKQSK